MQLIRAMPDDWPAVAALVQRAYGKWVPVIGRFPKPMTVDYRTAVINNRIDLLHTEGVLGGLIETLLEPGCLLVVNVAVDPRHQKSGYGRLLMQHAEDLARSAGLRVLRLYTNKLMSMNIRLYEKLGFERYERKDSEEGDNLVHMRKPL